MAARQEMRVWRGRGVKKPRHTFQHNEEEAADHKNFNKKEYIWNMHKKRRWTHFFFFQQNH